MGLLSLFAPCVASQSPQKELGCILTKHDVVLRIFILFLILGIKTAWTKNGEILEQTPLMKISDSDDEQRLEISRVEACDEGVYQIVASNDHGEVSCSARLRFGSEFTFSMDIAVMNSPLQTEMLHANFTLDSSLEID